MQEVIFKTTPRTLGEKELEAARKAGQVPGVVYGQGKEATHIQTDRQALSRAYQEAGTSRLVTLEIEGQDSKDVLFHDVQYDHLGKNIIHFDLYTVKMDEEIQTEVPIHYVGESAAVYEDGAIMLKNLETVEVKALPRSLPENIEVDISILTEMEQSILVKDLKVPEGVEIMADPEEMVVKLEAPREAEEEEELPENEADLVEAEHGGAKEEDEGEELPENKKGGPASEDTKKSETPEQKQDK